MSCYMLGFWDVVRRFQDRGYECLTFSVQRCRLVGFGVWGLGFRV